MKSIALAKITPGSTRMTLTYDVEAQILYAEWIGQNGFVLGYAPPRICREEVGKFESASAAESYISTSYGRDGDSFGLEWVEREQ